MQKNEYVPGRVNVCLHVFPGMMFPESNERSVAVTVWGSGSLFFHSIVVPAVISIRRCR